MDMPNDWRAFNAAASPHISPAPNITEAERAVGNDERAAGAGLAGPRWREIQ
jgi:hypothetical protein